MKILIWFLAALVFGLANAVLIENDILLGGLPTALLALVCIFLAKFLCRVWDRHKAEEETLGDVRGAHNFAADAENTKKDNRPVLRNVCIVLAICVVALSVSCVYLVIANGNLESEKLHLSNELREVQKNEEWGTGVRERYEARAGLEMALERFFFAYDEDAWEKLNEMLEQLSSEQ